jgi:hypothetical protein
MGTTRLEVFKFGLYVFIPVTTMYVYNRPDWAARLVGTGSLAPPPEALNRPPASVEDAHAAYEQLLRQRQRQHAAADRPAP